MSAVRNKFVPARGLSRLAVEFLSRHMPDFLPHANQDAVYDQDTDAFISKQKAEAEHAQKAVEDKRDRFVEALKKWDAENDKIKTESGKEKRKRGKGSEADLLGKVRADISAKHSWEQVFASLNDAKDGYNNPEGSRRWRKRFRKVADKSLIVKPFVDIIPGGDYTSVICGGLKFVLEACSAAKVSRDNIHDLIETLPQRVKLAGEYIELYKSEPQLQIATSTLYSTILSAIEAVMVHFMKDHIFEFLKPFFLQDAYSPLGQKMKELEGASNEFQEVLLLCDRKQALETNQGVKNIQEGLVETVNFLLQMLDDQFEHAKWLENLLQQKGQGPDNERLPPEYITWPEVVRLLLPSLYDTTDDVLLADKVYQEETTDKVLRAGFAMEKKELIRAGWLMSQKEIHQWFKSRQSRALLINGVSAVQRITEISFFTAMLIKRIKEIVPITVLYHYCGLNTSSYDDNKAEELFGGAGLLKALILQLLTQHKLRYIACLGLEEANELRHTAPNPGLGLLRLVFRKLITALETPVFIVIDNINYYETSELADDTKQAMEGIMDLLGDEKVKAMVKVMVTAANRAFEVGEYFMEKEKIRVPEEVSDNQMGFVDQRFNAEFGTDLEQLSRSTHYNSD